MKALNVSPHSYIWTNTAYQRKFTITSLVINIQWTTNMQTIKLRYIFQKSSIAEHISVLYCLGMTHSDVFIARLLYCVKRLMYETFSRKTIYKKMMMKYKTLKWVQCLYFRKITISKVAGIYNCLYHFPKHRLCYWS